MGILTIRLFGFLSSNSYDLNTNERKKITAYKQKAATKNRNTKWDNIYDRR